MKKGLQPYSVTLTEVQTVRCNFSAGGPRKSPDFWGRGERLGYRQWASNAEPTYRSGTQMIFGINSRVGIADYSRAKKNCTVLSELQLLSVGYAY